MLNFFKKKKPPFKGGINFVGDVHPDCGFMVQRVNIDNLDVASVGKLLFLYIDRLSDDVLFEELIALNKAKKSIKHNNIKKEDGRGHVSGYVIPAGRKYSYRISAPAEGSYFVNVVLRKYNKNNDSYVIINNNSFNHQEIYDYFLKDKFGKN